MSKTILYHGSTSIVEKPQYGKGKTYNDYGQGFYCTEHIEIAKEWACDEDIDGYVNKYEFDSSNLKILNLSSDNYNVLNWLAILMHNRIIRVSSPIAKLGKEYLLTTFLPDYNDYDAIIGYRADDSYFSFARSFVENTISLAQLSRVMKLGKLGEQVFLKSPKSFDSITFLGYEVVDSSVYYIKRKIRDLDARFAFEMEQEKIDLNGIYMRDVIREEMKQDDVRLR